MSEGLSDAIRVCKARYKKQLFLLFIIAIERVLHPVLEEMGKYSYGRISWYPAGDSDITTHG